MLRGLRGELNLDLPSERGPDEPISEYIKRKQRELAGKSLEEVIRANTKTKTKTKSGDPGWQAAHRNNTLQGGKSEADRIVGASPKEGGFK